jgi:hypothetical protein
MRNSSSISQKVNIFIFSFTNMPARKQHPNEPEQQHEQQLHHQERQMIRLLEQMQQPKQRLQQ